MGISVYVIARDEEANIGACLDSVAWADELVVVDSGSSDATAEVARRHGARVIVNPFEGFGRQRNFAVAQTRNPWVMTLDADERCSEGLREEILRTIAAPDAHDAYQAPRRNHFMGRWIRHGGWYPDYRHPVLFRRSAVTYRQDRVHEGFDVSGRTGRLRSDILHEPYTDLSCLERKIARYSDLGAADLIEKGRRVSRTRAVVNGAWAFVRSYVLRLGFLDGWPGFVIAVAGFESTFYRYAKAAELRRARTGATPP